MSASARTTGVTPPSVIRVRYADTDQMGITYHANYLVWFEVGRTDWLRETGWSYREMEADGLALMPWLLLILALGVVAGTLNGLLISWLRLQPFVVTLSRKCVCKDVSYLLETGNHD